MPSRTVLSLTVLGGGGLLVLSWELLRRRALVTRISAEVSRHREVGKHSDKNYEVWSEVKHLKITTCRAGNLHSGGGEAT